MNFGLDESTKVLSISRLLKMFVTSVDGSGTAELVVNPPLKMSARERRSLGFIIYLPDGAWGICQNHNRFSFFLTRSSVIRLSLNPPCAAIIFSMVGSNSCQLASLYLAPAESKPNHVGSVILPVLNS